MCARQTQDTKSQPCQQLHSHDILKSAPSLCVLASSRPSMVFDRQYDQRPSFFSPFFHFHSWPTHYHSSKCRYKKSSLDKSKNGQSSIVYTSIEQTAAAQHRRVELIRTPKILSSPAILQHQTMPGRWQNTLPPNIADVEIYSQRRTKEKWKKGKRH